MVLMKPRFTRFVPQIEFDLIDNVVQETGKNHLTESWHSRFKKDAIQDCRERIMHYCDIRSEI